MRVTREFLYSIAPGASAAIVDKIVENADRITITDPTELAWFMGQNAAETGGFTRIDENLKYLSVERIRKVWPSRFKSDAMAAPYVRNPPRLANFVYGGRYGNRPGTNDGWVHRGSGLNQTTFRDNYRRVQMLTNVAALDNPELLRTFPGAIDAAVVYWRALKLDRFVKTRDLVGLTKAIQGGSGGLQDRKTFTDRALKYVEKNAGFVSTPTRTVKTEKSEWLRNGAKGVDVFSAQQRLQAHGFYVGGKLDGDFGDGMELAVREFQKSVGLVGDGVVGGKTLAALAKEPAGTSTPENPATPATVPNSGLGAMIAALIQAILKLFAGKGGKNG